MNLMVHQDKRMQLAGAALIAALALWAYYPSLNGGFIFDDQVLLSDSPLIKAADGFYRVWFTTDQPDYVPLTSTTLWFEWRLWGMNPRGYHVANLILHIAACLLLWTLLRKLEIPGAFLAALLYAIHPVNVESVAWVEQRKDTLSTLFFLLAILWYLKSDPQSETPTYRLYRAGTGHWYWMGIVSFALSMFSKGSVATLPVALLIIVWWQKKRLTVSELIRSAPFFLVSAILTPVVIWFVAHGTGEVVREVTFTQRLLQAGSVVWFYLAKALVPIKLIFFYPLWDIQAGNLLWWLPLVAAATVTLLLVFRLRSAQANWIRPLLFAWLFFGVALAPAMGFFDPGYMKYSLVADHYQHLALLAVVSLIAAGITLWYQWVQGPLRWGVAGAAVLLVGIFTGLSWQQCHLYDNDIHMYEVTLKENPNCWMAHINLGTSLLTTGHTPEAIEHLSEALRLEPKSAEAHHDIANALAASGRTREAIAHYRQALAIRPNFVKTYCKLGTVLMSAGQFQEAIDLFQQALQLDPNFAEAHFCLANALSRSGHIDEALPEYELAVKNDPDNAEAHNTFGSLLVQTGHVPQAIEQFQQALRAKPDYREAHNNLAVALASTGQMPQAVEQFQQALALEPARIDTRFNLGMALAAAGRLQEAVDQFTEVLREQPNHLPSHAKLTATYAQLQQPDKAVATAEKGLELARSAGNTHMIAQFENWLTKYRAQQATAPGGSPATDVAPSSPSR